MVDVVQSEEQLWKKENKSIHIQELSQIFMVRVKAK